MLGNVIDYLLCFIMYFVMCYDCVVLNGNLFAALSSGKASSDSFK